MKNYQKRDTATAALRKIGVATRDYRLFRTKLEDGSFNVDLAAAEAHVNKEKVPEEPAPAPVEEKPKKASSKKKSSAKAKSDKPKRARTEPTMTSVCQDAILAGQTNEEVFKTLQDTFGADVITDKKKYYPAWNRSNMSRKGLIDGDMASKVRAVK